MHELGDHSEGGARKAETKRDGIIFIPVIRVQAPGQQERHTSQLTMNVNEEGKPPDGAAVRTGGGVSRISQGTPRRCLDKSNL